MVRKTFWNTSGGRFERDARRSLKAADLGPEDELASLAVLALAIELDQMLNSHALTLGDTVDFGDTKLAFHVRGTLAELGRAMDRCLLTPQARIPITETAAVSDPFADIQANVHQIMQGS